MTPENLIFKKEGHIAFIALNRPPAANAINRSMLEELERVLDGLYGDENIRVVVLTGEGKAFSAGADIAAMRGLTAEEGCAFIKYGQQQVGRLENLPMPVVCAINGYALGGGLEIAMACDIRIMAKDAKIGQPEVLLGVIPGCGATARLPRLINAGNAKYAIYTGAHMSAERAYTLDIVQELVEPDKLIARAYEIAATIAANAPIAVRMAKRVMNEGMHTSLTSAIALEHEAFATTFRTGDRAVGMAAFLEKRKPEFLNK